MKKNCVILKWNPAVSSYNFIRFLSDIGQDIPESDWSIHEYDKVKTGDRFFLLKVGLGVRGIVAAGEITCDPFPDNDWSKRDRMVFYSEYRCELMVNPETLPIIESSLLEKAIPDFDWSGGHAGVVLEPAQAETLYGIYEDYLKKNAALFAGRLDCIERRELYNDQLLIDDVLLEKYREK